MYSVALTQGFFEPERVRGNPELQDFAERAGVLAVNRKTSRVKAEPKVTAFKPVTHALGFHRQNVRRNVEYMCIHCKQWMQEHVDTDCKRRTYAGSLQ